MNIRLAPIVLGLAIFGSVAVGQTPADRQWQIGPIVRGENYSAGMPPRPVPTRTGWYFDFPHDSRADGHVNAVTIAPGSLAGKSQLVVHYRVRSAAGVRFVPQEQPNLPGTVSLFLQRRGDNWSGRGRHEFYRWYAPPHTVRELAPGVHRMTVDLRDAGWVSVQGRPIGTAPAEFTAALRDVGQLGLVFGSSSARAHGVFATGPARFELIDFRIE